MMQPKKVEWDGQGENEQLMGYELCSSLISCNGQEDARGIFQPPGQSPALPQELTLFPQVTRGAPRESHLGTNISNLNCIFIPNGISTALLQHRCSLLIQSHLSLSLSLLIFLHGKCKVKWQSCLLMPDYLVEVAISRMYHSELPRMSVNIAYGLQ